MAAEITKPPVAPLPATTEDLLAQRKLKSAPKLNDLVEDIFVQLWKDPDFHKLLEAVDNKQAVEGDVRLDHHEAARKIRDKAIKDEVDMVAQQQMKSVIHALHVVMKRYGVNPEGRTSA